jgi:hypothetical protein
MRSRSAAVALALALPYLAVTSGRAEAARAPAARDAGLYPRAFRPTADERLDADGVVYRYYTAYGYRFQPLSSFTRLNALVSAHNARAARRLALALIRRGVGRHGATYWEYDFPYGGPAPWSSGFVQAVAAQALARAGLLVDDASFIRVADASFRGLRRSLLMPLGGGAWVREYGFTRRAVLNAQLQSLLSLGVYAHIVQSTPASTVVARMYSASLMLLPRFDLGAWSRYELGGGAASSHYHAYHVELLRQLAIAYPDDTIWRRTYLRWLR